MFLKEINLVCRCCGQLGNFIDSSVASMIPTLTFYAPAPEVALSSSVPKRGASTQKFGKHADVYSPNCSTVTLTQLVSCHRVDQCFIPPIARTIQYDPVARFSHSLPPECLKTHEKHHQESPTQTSNFQVTREILEICALGDCLASFLLRK